MEQIELKSQTLVTGLLETMQDEMNLMNESTLRSLYDEVWKAVHVLRRAINAQRPIFSLPVELLVHIIEDIMPTTMPVGPSKINQFWRPSFRDGVALVPLSQTCHHLREITLAHPEWWSTLASNRIRHFPICAMNSRPLPLTVVPPPDGDTDVLHALDDSAAARIEELHIMRFNRALMAGVAHLFSRDSRAPALKAFTCIATAEDDLDSFRLVPDRVWALQRLVLDRMRFRLHGVEAFLIPSITHLVLSRSSVSHRSVIQLLSCCPSLENLVLSGLYHSVDGVVPSTVWPLSTRIRRLVLQDLLWSTLDFYLALIHPRVEGKMALQILNEDTPHNMFEYEPVIQQRLDGRTTHLRVGVFTDTASFYRFSLTLANPSNAIRIASTASNILSSRYLRPDEWLSRLLSPDVTNLSEVREAWLINTTAPFAVYLTTFQVRLRCALSALLALETVVLVTIDHPDDCPGNVHWPDISVLPTTHDPAFCCPRLKTVRMVHYDALPPRAQGDPNVTRFERAPIKMEFKRMLQQLSSGGYGYVENLVVEASPRFAIDEAEVEGLRVYFKSVRVERILGLPQMPLPPSCVGPDDGPGGRDSWTTTHY